MILLRRYDCLCGIHIGKVEGKIKAEGVDVTDDATDDNMASTEEIIVLDSDEDGDLSDDKEVKEENRPHKGPSAILYEGNGTLTHALVDEEETALEGAAWTTEERRGEKESGKTMPLAEVARNCRHNKCVPSSARLANAAKHRVWPDP